MESIISSSHMERRECYLPLHEMGIGLYVQPWTDGWHFWAIKTKEVAWDQGDFIIILSLEDGGKMFPSLTNMRNILLSLDINILL